MAIAILLHGMRVLLQCVRKVFRENLAIANFTANCCVTNAKWGEPRQPQRDPLMYR